MNAATSGAGHVGNVERVRVLSEALPYIQAFRAKTFVIKFGGSAMEEDVLSFSLLRDIVLLEAVGINPVLVHGGGKAISQRMAASGLEARFVGGQRVTDAASIRIVGEVLDGEINPALVEAIHSFGGRAQGFSGTRILEARKQPPRPGPDGAPLDLGLVGEVTRVDLSVIGPVLQAEEVPVISPLARGHDGQIYNVNADLAASAIATELRAAKLIYLSDVRGVLRDPKRPETLIPTIDPTSGERLIAEGVIAGGMIPKVRSAFDAIARGVEKVHMIDGRIPHGLLLEIFTDAGIGTEIVGRS